VSTQDFRVSLNEIMPLIIEQLRQGETVRLTVAATNERALRLYERLGFIKTAELSRWYRVLER